MRDLRTVWVSDIHLGTRGSQAGALARFLRQTACETLYLVGDVFDGWQLRRSWYWPESHDALVREVLRKARSGTRVVFIPGNHDAFARAFVGERFAGVEVERDCMHRTADGRTLWVTHGDQFDTIVREAHWLAYMGHVGVELAHTATDVLDYFRQRRGLPYWCLSRDIKRVVLRMMGNSNRFNEAIVAATRARGVDGVICGHIHRAEIRTVDGILYCNDGDWVESMTVLAEQADGQLELIDCSSMRERRPGRPPRGARIPQEGTIAGGLAALLRPASAWPSMRGTVRSTVRTTARVAVRVATRPRLPTGTPVSLRVRGFSRGTGQASASSAEMRSATSNTARF